MIVIVIRLAIVVEPGLHAFGEVLVSIDRCVLRFPQSGGHRTVVGFSQAGVEAIIDVDHAAQMNIVRELMNQDVLGGVRIAGIGEHVLLGAGAHRIRPRPPEPACARIPEILGLQAAILWDVGREFGIADHDHTRATIDHGLAHVWPLGQHHVDYIGGFLQRVVVNLAGTDHRITIRTHVLLIERVELQRRRRRADFEIGRHAGWTEDRRVPKPADGKPQESHRF